MGILQTLYTLGSLDEVEALRRDAAWTDALEERATQPDDSGREALRSALLDAKERLSPEHQHPELQALKERIFGDLSMPADERQRLLTRVADLRASLPLRRHEHLFGQLETMLGQRFASALGGTGYSNRARRARDLFTPYAGQTRIAGADTDRHGNAAGTGYDLGLDGAFEGHTVHVLQLYVASDFDFSKPRAAFERKGFRVERLTRPGTPDELAAWLLEARQLWLIGDQKRHLLPGHLDVIKSFWQRGGALYLWGDNQPYYADTNAVLADLFAPDLVMLGDTPGGKVVREIDESGHGFRQHLITTGLAHLFEGITVATVNADGASHHQFEPLLYGSAGNLITVVREPSEQGGAVAVDAAFTRLYCQWDDAGSARYVCNAACFLAAMTLPTEAPVEEETPADEEAIAPLAFDPTGAFEGTCDLTGQPRATWLSLTIGQMPDALRNTSDLVLTDPLSAGSFNHAIFSDRLYAGSLAPWIISQGTDPFTRQPVVGVLPLVDLSIERNQRAFTVELCKWLLGGKYLPTAARLLFFAVIDERLDDSRVGADQDAWRYLYRQSLAAFTSTPDFSNLGRPVPLLDAMAAFLSPATDAFTQLRLSLASIGVMGRTALREGRVTREQLALVARRALVKVIVGDAVAADKAAPGTVTTMLTELLYRSFHGIPVLNGGRLVSELPAFVRPVASVQARLERDLGAPLLPASELTLVLHSLLGLDLRQYTADSALRHLLGASSAFASVWNTTTAPDALALLDERFAAYRDPIDPRDPHLGVPPFATTYGASVYRCLCGATFGDPAAELTPEAIMALQRARNSHFHEVYRVRGPHWYPGEGSLHCNLHRAVQRVVSAQFTDATTFTDAMVPAVAAYLREDGKGFLCSPDLERDIVAALGSYLRLRHAGQPHPVGVMTLAIKAEIERQLGAAGVSTAAG